MWVWGTGALYGGEGGVAGIDLAGEGECGFGEYFKNEEGEKWEIHLFSGC
jgi:hypothetical protein